MNEYTPFSVDETNLDQTKSTHQSEKNKKRCCPSFSLVQPKQIIMKGEGTCSEVTSLLFIVLFVSAFTTFIINQLSPIDEAEKISNNDIIRYIWVEQISSFIGYAYFLSWALAALPQLILNFTRKTTVGLSIDAYLMQVLGLLCYTIYNMAMYWSQTVKTLYSARHEGKPNRVDGNDLAFSIYGLFVSSSILSQIFFYAHKNAKKSTKETIANVKYYQMDLTQNKFQVNQNDIEEKSSLPSGIKPAKSTVSFIALVAITITLYVYGILHYEYIKDQSSSPTGLQKYLNWLDFCYALSYIKIISVTLKYVPQVILNYQRKSTKGWSIWTVVLDINGGLLSILQLILDCWNANDWSGILGNLAKFLLGFISVVFDIIFILQHYVFFPQ